MEQSVIISYKYGIDELPHEFPNDLNLELPETRKDQKNLKTS